MASILSALLPVFLLIVLGFALRRSKFMPDLFWPSIEKLTYYVFFPALLFENCRKVPLAGGETAQLLAAMGLGVAGTALLALACLRLAPGRPAFSSLFQGSIRPNTYVGLAAASALYGQSGVALTSVCVALVVPLVNLLSVLAMLAFGEGQKPSGPISALKPVIANPLIIACLLGLGFNGAELGLPEVAARFLTILAGASLPMGLLAVGAGVDPGALFRAGKPVLASALLKMVALPLATLAFLKLFGLGAPAQATGFLYALLPCSASSYVLARQMGGDATLMANIISAQTVLAMLSMPFFLILFGFTP